MQLDHRNVVKYLDGAMRSEGSLERLSVIMELCDGTMDDVIRCHRWIKLLHVSILAEQVIDGLVYIHSQNVIHRYPHCTVQHCHKCQYLNVAGILSLLT